MSESKISLLLHSTESMATYFLYYKKTASWPPERIFTRPQ